MPALTAGGVFSSFFDKCCYVPPELLVPLQVVGSMQLPDVESSASLSDKKKISSDFWLEPVRAMFLKGKCCSQFSRQGLSGMRSGEK